MIPAFPCNPNLQNEYFFSRGDYDNSSKAEIKIISSFNPFIISTNPWRGWFRPSYRPMPEIFVIDYSSLVSFPKIRRETSALKEMSRGLESEVITEEDILSELVDSNIYVPLKPNKERLVKFKIKEVKKSIPKIVEPEGT